LTATISWVKTIWRLWRKDKRYILTRCRYILVTVADFGCNKVG
jgi:hypothetical protein